MPEVTVELPRLYRKQAAAVLDPARIVCIESTTKAGKTLSCIIWQIAEMLRSAPDTEHWWVAPVYQQADMAFREAWKLLRGKPGFRQSLSDRSIIGPSERRWMFKSADKPDNLYGSAVSSAVLDEASRMKDDSVDAVYSTTTATRGRMRLIGNVRGRSNRHYQWSRKAEAGEPGFAYHRLTADDAVNAGLWHAADLEMARRSMPHAVFRQLYYCEPSDDGANPFGIDSIRACAEVNGGRATGAPVRVWGLDIARKRDHTVLIGLDSNRHVAQFHRWHGLPYSKIVEMIVQIVGPQSRACVFFDATGVGDPVGEQIAKARVFCEPFIFSSASKQGLMEGLAVALQQGRTSVIDGVHRSELEGFEYEMRGNRIVYEAPSSMNDDAVCAHALAWYGAERMGVSRDVRRVPKNQATSTRVNAW